MKASLVVRRVATGAVVLVAVIIAITLALLAAVDAGYGRSLLIHYVAVRLGRPVEIKGALQAHLFSHHPEVTAEDVVIGNPSWMPAGVFAEVGRFSLSFAWPGLAERSGITRLAMQDAAFHLLRDATGHANWQRTDPGKASRPRSSWIIRSLSVPNAHVVLADEFQDRKFVGSLSVNAPSDTGTVALLRIDGNGQLNGRAVSFRLTADSLATASHDHPYHFRFAERSSGSHLEVRGFLPRPFEFDHVDASCEAAGPDLKDLYFLTGAHLLDTGPYHLSARASRHGKHTDYRDLVVTTGQSEVDGTASIDYTGPRRKLDLTLNSRSLFLSDLGLRAAGRNASTASPLLLSNAAFSPQRMRASEVALLLSARTVAVGRLTLHELRARARIDHGVLTVMPMSADVSGGHIDARFRIDAHRDVPAANMDLSIADLQLGQLPYSKPGAPPIEGPLRAHLLLAGSGRSLHQFAASANGTVRAQLPHGAIRASLAELAGGIDLRALGLLLAHDERDVPIRCATATFQAESGVLTAQRLLADTDPALITGEGQIHLDTEDLDLALRGQAKRLRFFRLRAPVLVQGTLAHPSIRIQKGKSVPLIVDPAKAEDADCAELLDEPIVR